MKQVTSAVGLFLLLAIVAVYATRTTATAGKPLPTPPASQPAPLVKIENFAFIPKSLEVPAGTAVTWQNEDDVPHTASSNADPQAFDSGALDTDDKFSFTFKTPGKYTYFCKVHPHMTGVVIVK